MNENRDFTQDTLKRIRSGEKPENSLKKRRLSRIILFIDIIIVVLILAYFNRRGTESYYHTNSLTLNNLEYRFSLVNERKYSNYIFSLTIKSNSTSEEQYYYNKSIADLTIQHDKEIIYKTSIGDNITSIKLLPGEIKTIVKEIDTNYFIKYAKEHTEYIIPKNKTLLALERRHIPLQAIITLNTSEVISTILNFKFEIE